MNLLMIFGGVIILIALTVVIICLIVLGISLIVDRNPHGSNPQNYKEGYGD